MGWIERAFVSLAVFSFLVLIAGVVALAIMYGSGSMQQRAYRAFEIGKDGHFAGRIDLRYCPNDEAAKQWAKRLVDVKAIELWDGSRRIARFEPKKLSH
jgi:hypothetical protein